MTISEHHHSHHHLTDNKHRTAFGIGITLNILFILIEIIYGIKANSSALIADAGHNISDVFSLIFSWIGIWLALQHPKGNYSYGYKKSTILISIVNALILFIAILFIFIDAFPKFYHPSPVAGNQIMIVAAIGIIINGLTAMLFYKGQKQDLNIKGAFLHMSADAAVSLGVVIAGLLIRKTGLYWIDPLMSMIIILIIAFSTWKLLVDSIRLAIDAVPKNIDLKEVQALIMQHNNVVGIHELHIWALSTSENALSTHILINTSDANSVLKDIDHLLRTKFQLNYVTIQIESEDDPVCHAKQKKRLQ